MSPYDALTLGVTPLVLIAVALAGCLGPARAATHIDPAVALRQE